MEEDRDAESLRDFDRRIAAPVVNEQRKLVGIVSEKDVLSVLGQQDSFAQKVGEIMRTNVVCYEEEISARKIFDFLCRVSIRRVVIVADGGLNGGTAEQIEKVVQQAVDCGMKGVIVDCSKLDIISSTGLEIGRAHV